MSAGARAANSIVLPIEQSAALRDRLISELAGLQSQDSAAAWAREALPLKNTLTAADARLVETAFALKQSAFSLSHGAEPSPQDLRDTTAAAAAPTAAAAPPAAADQLPSAQRLRTSGGADGHEAARIDKTVLTLSTPRRYRNKEHLRFVAQQPCLLCGRKPSDAHHLGYMQPRALGSKASDEFAVPLCRAHHRAAHRAGDERAWWKNAGLDPIKIARKLWKETRTNTGSPARPNISSQSAQPSSR
jgi:hypothetical protein